VTAPVAGRSPGPQDLQSARYTSRLPVAMRWPVSIRTAVIMATNYDDAQKQIVPNSQSDYATSDGSGPESGFDCHVTKFRFSYHVTCRLSVLQAVLVYWSAGFCQIYSLKCYSRNYSEICAKFMQILRQMLHFLQFLCMQIDACHLSKGIITSSFISLNIIYFGLCFQHLRSCPALYFVMDPYFGIKLNLLLDL
jgi:hypothetical protein